MQDAGGEVCRLSPAALEEPADCAPGHHVVPVGVEVALDAVRDPLDEIEIRDRELVDLSVRGAEVRIAARDVILEVGVHGDPDAPCERLPAAVDAADQARGAEVVQRVSERLPVVSRSASSIAFSLQRIAASASRASMRSAAWLL